MSIFNGTPEEKLHYDATSLMQAAESQAAQVIDTFQKFADFVWNHPTYTPQQVLDVFGQEAARLFYLSNAVLPLVQVYTGQIPNIVPRNYTYEFHDDGSVTVTYNPDTINSVPQLQRKDRD